MWPEMTQFNVKIQKTCPAKQHLHWVLVLIRVKDSYFFLSSARLMQLGIFVNNGAVTHTRCLSTRQAPTVPDFVENDLCVQDLAWPTGSTFIIIKLLHAQETNCLLGLTVSPAHLATLCHMLDLTAQSVYGSINLIYWISVCRLNMREYSGLV